MNTRINTVFVMVATLGLVLSTGILTIIDQQQAFALTRTHAGTDNNSANGANGANGGQGGNGANGGIGVNGGNGKNATAPSTTQPSPPQS